MIARLMVTFGSIGTIASQMYIKYSTPINRAIVLTYEAATGEVVIMGRGMALGAEAAMSKVEGGIGTWVKAVAQVGRGVVLAPYGYLKQFMKGSGWQANHLNQSAAFTRI